MWGISRGACRVLAGKPEGRRPLGRPRPGWEDNIKMGIRTVGLEVIDWIDLTQDRERWGKVEGCCECGNEPSCFIKCGEFLD